ncbi:transporter substrate-binding domain-containing protein [Lacimicrobium sp. SS2-24]|uniref:substrate-binding periplasmic protein n=1 Tax=Lacimicrobium sp. SS2-24 TaxID=2005569 RepID=UPI00143978DC|nr:transporter substrate-binding domain-containing protein [Lacimicrobium sp. SS2-24]
MRQRIGLAGLLAFSCVAMAEPAEVREKLTIGVQAIDHYPHYDMTDGTLRGFAGELFRLFAENEKLQLEFVPLPVKRLPQEVHGSLDFVYPDNPKWQALREGDDGRHYSQPVVSNWGVAMVLPQNRDITLGQLRSLSIVRGFTPTKWMALQPQYRYQFVEVQNTRAASMMALKGRVDAAEVEYYVAMHHLRKLGLEDSLVVAESLPQSNVWYHVSTVEKLDMLERFDLFLLRENQAIEALIEQFGLRRDP